MLATRGLFMVQSSSMDEAFETLVGVCGELGAKLSNIDTLEHQIDGKSKRTWKTWGIKFHARVIKNPSGAYYIEVYDLARLSTDIFIKKLYNKIKKYAAVSPLTVDFFTKILHATREGDTRFSGYERAARSEESGEPLPGGGSPEMAADIPDDNSKALQMAGKLCGKCGAPNPSDSRLCNKCGHRIISCPACGHVPEEDSSFCIKCGAKLA